LSTRRLLLALGDLLVGWLLLRQAEVALAKLDGADGADRAFYEGKVAAARFFAREVLPRLAADRRVVEGATLDAMDLPEEAFWASIRRRRPSGQPGRWAGSRAGGPANDQPAHQAGGPAHGQLIHSSVPSAKTCRFHTGRRAFTSSTSGAQAGNASARCAHATAAASATSPTWRTPMRWETATPRTCGSAVISAATSLSTASALGWASYSRSVTCRPWSWSRTTPAKLTTAPAPRSAT